MYDTAKRSLGKVVGALALVAGTAACGTVRAGYESAAYTVERADGPFEVRNYDSLTLVGTQAGLPRQQSENSAFSRLFRYISGSNTDERKIAMTTPVFSTEEHADEGMEMFFVLPKADASTAPDPTDDTVRLVTQDAMTVAAVRFSGRMNTNMMEARKTELIDWVIAQGYEAAGDIWVAQYDPPWTPGPLRRNEVLVPIASTTQP